MAGVVFFKLCTTNIQHAAESCQQTRVAQLALLAGQLRVNRGESCGRAKEDTIPQRSEFDENQSSHVLLQAFPIVLQGPRQSLSYWYFCLPV